MMDSNNEVANKLTKARLIDNVGNKLAERSIITSKREIHTILDALLDEVKEALYNGESVELRGFGTFELRHRKGRESARNPKTGEVLSVPSHMAAVFRPGKELRNQVREVKP